VGGSTGDPSYFVGTTEEIVERIDDLRQAGLQYLVIGLLD